MRNKLLQILFGLALILLLAYIAFLDVSIKIKDDLLTKSRIVFSQNNVINVNAKIEGIGLNMSRTLVLWGSAISDIERMHIVTLAENIEGICRIDNQISISPIVTKVEISPKIQALIELPSVKILQEISILKKIEKVDNVVKKTKKVVEIPSVPIVENKKVLVPRVVKVIAVPKVIKVEKIKFKGIK